MKLENLFFHFSVVILFTAIITLPVAAEAAQSNAKNRAFYGQLSCKASKQAVAALAKSMEARGVSQLDFNKAIIDAFQGTSLSPNGPRWQCCKACVDNDQPNDSAACQCCDGLGDNVIDTPVVEQR